MVASAFSPSHLTGFFSLSGKGSAGAGITLDKGVKTTVKFAAKGAKKDCIAINGKTSAAPVSTYAAGEYRRLTGANRFFRISHSSFFPVGYGFGTSASGALSLSLALNKLLGTKLPYKRCIKIAADADFSCGCGVSGVLASGMGGFLFRKTPTSRVIKLPFSKNSLFLCAPLSPISTKNIITSKEQVQRIAKAGEKCIASFSANPSLQNFCLLSNQFAFRTKIAPRSTLSILKTNPDFGMAQLGNTLFAIAESRKEFKEKKKRMGKYGRVLAAGLSGKGAKALYTLS